MAFKELLSMPPNLHFVLTSLSGKRERERKKERERERERESKGQRTLLVITYKFESIIRRCRNKAVKKLGMREREIERDFERERERGVTALAGRALHGLFFAFCSESQSSDQTIFC
jgi:hypothetical protein